MKRLPLSARPGLAPVSRRRFLQSGATTLAAAAAAPLILPRRVFGAADRLTLGMIGVGGMGGYHLGAMLKYREQGQVNLAAVCDADDNRLAAALKRVGGGCVPYRDYRHILERQDIDAVILATPDHWHALQTVHAAECRKHVYVEKPACGTIEEGKAMVAAATKNRIAVQVGSQGRSQPECHAAHQYIANGMIGRVHKVTCWHYASPADTQPVPDSEPPPELDWDLWLGPLPWRPYNPRYCHGTFRWMMDSGGGQIRDRGAHVMSNALWMMEADHTGPATITATGTRPKIGVWDSAIDMEVTYSFKNPDWTLVWAQPGTPVPYFDRDKLKREGIREGYGAVYHGDRDSIVVWVGDGQVYTERKAVEYQPPPGAKEVYKSPGHHEDWFQGIRTGRKTIMNVEAGVATAFLTILGNLSLLLGRTLHWDPVRQEIVGDPQAARLMSRPQRYPWVL